MCCLKCSWRTVNIKTLMSFRVRLSFQEDAPIYYIGACQPVGRLQFPALSFSPSPMLGIKPRALSMLGKCSHHWAASPSSCLNKNCFYYLKRVRANERRCPRRRSHRCCELCDTGAGNTLGSTVRADRGSWGGCWKLTQQGSTELLTFSRSLCSLV